MSDVLIGLAEIFNGSKGAAIATVIAFLLMWLISKLFDAKKKEMFEMLSNLRVDIGDIKKEVSQIKEYNHKQEVLLEHMKGQLATALALPGQVESIKEKLWNVDSKVDAAWRVIDKKRASDV